MDKKSGDKMLQPRSRYGLWFKIVASIIIKAFLVTDIVWAAGGDLRWLKQAEVESSYLSPSSNIQQADFRSRFNLMTALITAIDQPNTQKAIELRKQYGIVEFQGTLRLNGEKETLYIYPREEKPDFLKDQNIQTIQYNGHEIAVIAKTQTSETKQPVLDLSKEEFRKQDVLTRLRIKIEEYTASTIKNQDLAMAFFNDAIGDADLSSRLVKLLNIKSPEKKTKRLNALLSQKYDQQESLFIIRSLRDFGILEQETPEELQWRAKLEGCNVKLLEKLDAFGLVKKVNKFLEDGTEDSIRRLDLEQLKNKTKLFKNRLAEGESFEDILPEAAAVFSEVLKRKLGKRLYDVQLISGLVASLGGKVLEQATGEGKTFATALAAYLLSLRDVNNQGVRCATSDAILAKGNAAEMTPVFEALGLSVAVLVEKDEALTIVDGKSYNIDRAQAYKNDIVYATMHAFAYDHLGDNIVDGLEEPKQQEYFAMLVDEIDQILIDEARNPLIISGPGKLSKEEQTNYYLIDEIIRSLKKDVDYKIDKIDKSVAFTQYGYAHIETLLFGEKAIEQRKAQQETDPELKGLLEEKENEGLCIKCENALKAHHEEFRYIVEDGEIVIVSADGFAQPGQRYQDGLHQAMEAKEHNNGKDVEVKGELETLAKITLAQYLSQYEITAGLTGTAPQDAAMLFKTIYGLETVKIPTHKPRIRRDLPDRLFAKKAEKLEAAVKQINIKHREGMPILAVTEEVDGSTGLASQIQRSFEGQEKETIVVRSRDDVYVLVNKVLGREILENELKEAVKEIHDKGNFGDVVPIFVLNASTVDHIVGEAISLAGIGGAITVATGVAGRGKDIVLDQMSKINAGLFVIGVEYLKNFRYEWQLRGRSGRQGQPGTTCFYTSLEDDLFSKSEDARKFSQQWKENIGNDGMEVKDKVAHRINKIRIGLILNQNKQLESLVKYEEMIGILMGDAYEFRELVRKSEDLYAILSQVCPEKAGNYNLGELIELALEKVSVEELKEIIRFHVRSAWQDYLKDNEQLRRSINLRRKDEKDLLAIFKKESAEAYEELTQIVGKRIAGAMRYAFADEISKAEISEVADERLGEEETEMSEFMLDPESVRQRINNGVQVIYEEKKAETRLSRLSERLGQFITGEEKGTPWFRAVLAHGFYAVITIAGVIGGLISFPQVETKIVDLPEGRIVSVQRTETNFSWKDKKAKVIAEVAYEKMMEEVAAKTEDAEFKEEHAKDTPEQRIWLAYQDVVQDIIQEKEDQEKVNSFTSRLLAQTGSITLDALYGIGWPKPVAAASPPPPPDLQASITLLSSVIAGQAGKLTRGSELYERLQESIKTIVQESMSDAKNATIVDKMPSNMEIGNHYSFTVKISSYELNSLIAMVANCKDYLTKVTLENMLRGAILHNFREPNLIDENDKYKELKIESFRLTRDAKSVEVDGKETTTVFEPAAYIEVGFTHTEQIAYKGLIYHIYQGRGQVQKYTVRFTQETEQGSRFIRGEIKERAKEFILNALGKTINFGLYVLAGFPSSVDAAMRGPELSSEAYKRGKGLYTIIANNTKLRKLVKAADKALTAYIDNPKSPETQTALYNSLYALRYDGKSNRWVTGAIFDEIKRLQEDGVGRRQPVLILDTQTIAEMAELLEKGDDETFNKALDEFRMYFKGLLGTRITKRVIQKKVPVKVQTEKAVDQNQQLLRIEQQKQEQEEQERSRLEQQKQEQQRQEALRLKQEAEEQEKQRQLKLAQEAQEKERQKQLKLKQEVEEREDQEKSRLKQQVEERKSQQQLKLKQEAEERERQEKLKEQQVREEQERLRLLEKEKIEQEKRETIKPKPPKRRQVAEEAIKKTSAAYTRAEGLALIVNNNTTLRKMIEAADKALSAYIKNPQLIDTQNTLYRSLYLLRYNGRRNTLVTSGLQDEIQRLQQDGVGRRFPVIILDKQTINEMAGMLKKDDKTLINALDEFHMYIKGLLGEELIDEKEQERLKLAKEARERKRQEALRLKQEAEEQEKQRQLKLAQEAQEKERQELLRRQEEERQKEKVKAAPILTQPGVLVPPPAAKKIQEFRHEVIKGDTFIGITKKLFKSFGFELKEIETNRLWEQVVDIYNKQNPNNQIKVKTIGKYRIALIEPGQMLMLKINEEMIISLLSTVRKGVVLPTVKTDVAAREDLAAQAEPAEKVKPFTHKVGAGDTVTKIALKFFTAFGIKVKDEDRERLWREFAKLCEASPINSKALMVKRKDNKIIDAMVFLGEVLTLEINKDVAKLLQDAKGAKVSPEEIPTEEKAAVPAVPTRKEALQLSSPGVFDKLFKMLQQVLLSKSEKGLIDRISKIPVAERNYEMGLANIIVQLLASASNGHYAVATTPLETKDPLKGMDNIYFYNTKTGKLIPSRDANNTLYNLITKDLRAGTIDNVRDIEIWIGQKGTEGARPYIPEVNGKPLIFKSLLDLNKIAPTQLRFYLYPQTPKDADEYGRGRLITEPKEIRELQELGVNFDIWLAGEDDEGKYEYRLNFGVASAVKTLNNVVSYAQSRTLQHEVFNITSNLDLVDQQKIIQLANQGKDKKGDDVETMISGMGIEKNMFGELPKYPMQKNSPYIGAIVRQEQGLLKQVVTYIQPENINRHYDMQVDVKLPNGKKGKLYQLGPDKKGLERVYYFYKDAEGEIKYRRMHFLAYDRAGNLVEVKPSASHDVIAISPHEESKDARDVKLRALEEKGDWSQSDIIMFGRNALHLEELRANVGELMHRIAVDNAKKYTKQLKRRMIFEAILLPINLIGGAQTSGILHNLANPVAQAGLRLIFDALFVSPTLPSGVKVEGAVLKDSLETFLLSYIYYHYSEEGKDKQQLSYGDLVKGEDPDFIRYVEDQKKKDNAAIKKWLKMAKDDAPTMSFVEYVNGQRNYSVALFCAGILDNLARLNYKDFEKDKTFRDILASRYFSLQGEVNILAVLGAILGNDALGRGFDARAFKEGYGDYWENYMNFFGVTVRIQAVMNTLSHLVSNKKVFTYEPQLPQRRSFQVYIGGFPLFTFFELESTKNFIEKAGYFGYEIKTSNKPWEKAFYVDQVKGYNQAEFLDLNLIPLGDVVSWDEEGKPIIGEDGFPIRRVYYYNVDTGGVVFLGDKGYKSRLARLQEDVEQFDAYMSLVGPRGGRIEKKKDDLNERFLSEFKSRQSVGKIDDRDFMGGILSLPANLKHRISDLPPSFTYPRDNVPVNANSVHLYDLAVKSLSYGFAGLREAQSNILNEDSDAFLNYLIQNRWLYFGDDPDKGLISGGLYNTLDIDRLPAELQKPIADYAVHAGPSAWATAALLQGVMRDKGSSKIWHEIVKMQEEDRIEAREDFLQKGKLKYLFQGKGETQWKFWGMRTTKLKEFHESLSAHSKSYLEQAKKLGNFLIELQDIDGGIRHGPHELHVKATEENIVSFGVFMMLYEITGEDKYQDAAEGVLKWLSKVYDMEKGMFYRGMKTDRTETKRKQVWELDKMYATDANALSIIVVGPEILNNVRDGGSYLFRSEQPQALTPATLIINNIKSKKATVDHYEKIATDDYDSKVVKIASAVTGHDFTDKEGYTVKKGELDDEGVVRQPYERDPVVSPEMTLHVIKAHLTMADYYRSIGREDLAKAEEQEAEMLFVNLTKIARSTELGIALPDNTIPKHAIETGIKRYKDSIRFSLPTLASMNSLWFIFARANVNPFDIHAVFNLEQRAPPLARPLMKIVKNKDTRILQIKIEIDNLVKDKALYPDEWTEGKEILLSKKLKEISKLAKEYTQAKIIASNGTHEEILDQIVKLLELKISQGLSEQEEAELKDLKTKHPYFKGWEIYNRLVQKKWVEGEIVKLESKGRLTQDEQNRLTSLRQELAGLGSEDLISSDLIYKGIFTYFDNENKTTVTVILIPPAKIINFEHRKRENMLVDAKTHFSLWDKGGAIVTDRKSGELLTDGIQVGKDKLEHFLEVIEKMPIRQQQKIMQQHWVFDTQYKGKDVTVTLVFPYHTEFVREWINPVTGVKELRIFRYGLLNKVITKDTITEHVYNDSDVEISTRTYDNLNGTLTVDARKGKQIQKTLTLSSEIKDDGSQLVTKEVTDNVLNDVRYEVYNGYPLPSITVSKKYITEITYDDFGHFKSSQAWINTGTLDKPKKGDKIFIDIQTKLVTANEKYINEKTYNQSGREISSVSWVNIGIVDNPRKGNRVIGKVILEGEKKIEIHKTRYDQRFETEKTIIQDEKGREIKTIYGRKITLKQYSKGHYHGKVPEKVIIVNRSNPKQILEESVGKIVFDEKTSQTTIKFVDRLNHDRRFSAVYDLEHEGPIRYETDAVYTTFEYNREETKVISRTFDKKTNQEVVYAQATFDVASGLWVKEEKRFYWEITAKETKKHLIREELKYLDVFGLLLSGINIEENKIYFVEYTEDGIRETARKVYAYDKDKKTEDYQNEIPDEEYIVRTDVQVKSLDDTYEKWLNKNGYKDDVWLRPVRFINILGETSLRYYPVLNNDYGRCIFEITQDDYKILRPASNWIEGTDLPKETQFFNPENKLDALMDSTWHNYNGQFLLKHETFDGQMLDEKNNKVLMKKIYMNVYHNRVIEGAIEDDWVRRVREKRAKEMNLSDSMPKYSDVAEFIKFAQVKLGNFIDNPYEAQALFEKTVTILSRQVQKKQSLIIQFEQLKAKKHMLDVKEEGFKRAPKMWLPRLRKLAVQITGEQIIMNKQVSDFDYANQLTDKYIRHLHTLFNELGRLGFNGNRFALANYYAKVQKIHVNTREHKIQELRDERLEKQIKSDEEKILETWINNFKPDSKYIKLKGQEDALSTIVVNLVARAELLKQEVKSEEDKNKLENAEIILQELLKAYVIENHDLENVLEDLKNQIIVKISTDPKQEAAEIKANPLVRMDFELLRRDLELIKSLKELWPLVRDNRKLAESGEKEALRQLIGQLESARAEMKRLKVKAIADDNQDLYKLLTEYEKLVIKKYAQEGEVGFRFAQSELIVQNLNRKEEEFGRIRQILLGHQRVTVDLEEDLIKDARLVEYLKSRVKDIKKRVNSETENLMRIYDKITKIEQLILGIDNGLLNKLKELENEIYPDYINRPLIEKTAKGLILKQVDPQSLSYVSGRLAGITDRRRENVGLQKSIIKMNERIMDLSHNMPGIKKVHFEPNKDHQQSLENPDRVGFTHLILKVDEKSRQGTGLPVAFEGTTRSTTSTAMLWVEDILGTIKAEKDTKAAKVAIDRLCVLFDFYYYETQRQKVIIGDFKGIFSMYWADTGALGEDSIYVVDSAKLLQNLVRYMEITGDENPAYLALAEDLADYLVSIEDEDEGGIFRFADLKEKYILNKEFHGGKDTLDNIYAWVALKRYIGFLENKKADAKTIGNLNAVADRTKTWIDSQYDKDKGYFKAGITLDNKPDEDLSVDLQLTAYFVFDKEYFSCVEHVLNNCQVRDKVRRFRRVIPSDWLQDDITRNFWYAKELLGIGFGKEFDEKTNRFIDPNGQISYTLTSKTVMALELYKKQNPGDTRFDETIKTLKETLKYSVAPDISADTQGLPAASDYGENYKGVVNTNHDDLNNLEPTLWYQWLLSNKTPNYGTEAEKKVLELKPIVVPEAIDIPEAQKKREQINWWNNFSKQLDEMSTSVKKTIFSFWKVIAKGNIHNLLDIKAVKNISPLYVLIFLPAFPIVALCYELWRRRRLKERRKDEDLEGEEDLEPIKGPDREPKIGEAKPNQILKEKEEVLGKDEAKTKVNELLKNAVGRLHGNEDIKVKLEKFLEDSPAKKMWILALTSGIEVDGEEKAAVDEKDIVKSIKAVIDEFTDGGKYVDLLAEEDIRKTINLRLKDEFEDAKEEYDVSMISGEFKFKRKEKERELEYKIKKFNKKFPAGATDEHNAEKLEFLFDIIHTAVVIVYYDRREKREEAVKRGERIEEKKIGIKDVLEVINSYEDKLKVGRVIGLSFDDDLIPLSTESRSSVIHYYMVRVASRSFDKYFKNILLSENILPHLLDRALLSYDKEPSNEYEVGERFATGQVLSLSNRINAKKMGLFGKDADLNKIITEIISAISSDVMQRIADGDEEVIKRTIEHLKNKKYLIEPKESVTKSKFQRLIRYMILRKKTEDFKAYLDAREIKYKNLEYGLLSREQQDVIDYISIRYNKKLADRFWHDTIAREEIERIQKEEKGKIGAEGFKFTTDMLKVFSIAAILIAGLFSWGSIFAPFIVPFFLKWGMSFISLFWSASLKGKFVIIFSGIGLATVIAAVINGVIMATGQWSIDISLPKLLHNFSLYKLRRPTEGKGWDSLMTVDFWFKSLIGFIGFGFIGGLSYVVFILAGIPVLSSAWIGIGIGIITLLAAPAFGYIFNQRIVSLEVVDEKKMLNNITDLFYYVVIEAEADILNQSGYLLQYSKEQVRRVKT